MVRSVFSRFLSVTTVLTLVLIAASADLQPETALASTMDRSDLFAGAYYRQDDNRNGNNEDGNGNNEDNGNQNDNGNREDSNDEDRDVDTGPQISSAGNGGVATASADGGAVLIGDVNSGGNAGNAIGVGDTSFGSVTLDGGDVANSTSITVTVDGGTAIGDASGGNGNLAGVQD